MEQTYRLSDLYDELLTKIYEKYPESSDEFVAMKLGVSIADFQEIIGRPVICEYNLANLERVLFEKAFEKYTNHRDRLDKICSALGTSMRTIYRKLNEDSALREKFYVD